MKILCSFYFADASNKQQYIIFSTSALTHFVLLAEAHFTIILDDRCFFKMQYFARTVTGWCIQMEIQPPELLFNHYHDWLISVPMTSTAYPDGNRLSVSGWKWDFTSHALLWFEGIWIPLHLWCISKHSQYTTMQWSISHWCLLVLLK